MVDARACSITRSPLILYVITDLEIGGVPLHLSRLAGSMHRSGFQVVVVSLAPTGPVGSILSDQGVRVLSCDGCCGLDFRVISRLGEIIDELQPDVIHTLLFHANQAARIAAMLTGFPVDRIMCEIQTVEVERRWHLWIDRLMHQFSRVTIGNSPSVIEHLHRMANIPRNRLELVCGGIDIRRINDAAPIGRTSLGLNDTDRVLMWVGRLDPVKGLHFLLRALRMVIDQHSAQLLLVGDGPERQRLQSLAESLELKSCVHFLGSRIDVPSLLKVANVFVFPSRTEGLPNALLEAMAAAKPIVTTDVPGCRDLITHERTGLIVPYGDTPALSAAIVRILTNPDLAVQLSRNAENQVGECWDIESMFRKYESIYHQIID